MASLARFADHATGWQVLVQEIAEIEELIVDARKPSDPQALWSLHLLQCTLRLKRQQLKDHMSTTTSLDHNGPGRVPVPTSARGL